MVHFNGTDFRFAQSLHKREMSSRSSFHSGSFWCFWLAALTSSSVADPLIYSHATLFYTFIQLVLSSYKNSSIPFETMVFFLLTNKEFFSDNDLVSVLICLTGQS